MRPEDQRHAGALHHAPEERLGPRGMTNHDVEALPVQQIGKSASRRPHRLRPAGPRRWKRVNPHAGAPELGTQTSVEAERRLVLDVTGDFPMPRQCNKRGLDPAEQVAAVHMKRAHHAAVTR
jgi:hypothetical protein